MPRGGRLTVPKRTPSADCRSVPRRTILMAIAVRFSTDDAEQGVARRQQRKAEPAKSRQLRVDGNEFELYSYSGQGFTQGPAREQPMVLAKIVSGGETGVDRGALDAALALGFPCGGWCPADRSAEDGPIPQRYPLTPLPGIGYRRRTRQNVIDSDGTVIL